jgi:hypothetical protein
MMKNLKFCFSKNESQKIAKKFVCFNSGSYNQSKAFYILFLP